MKSLGLALAGWIVASAFTAADAAERPIKVLIVGGQNNHDWKKSTPFMKQLLDKSDHFAASVDNAPPQGAPQADWDAWQPNFRRFDCVVLDYNGQMWPERVKKDFLEYVRNGGGVLAIHAANNSFTGWKEYEQMLGLLWRGRDYGASLYVDDSGKVVREERGQGRGMGHGGQYDWKMTVRDPEHPVTQGMPIHWMHKQDELYHGQRGPAENVHILVTAYSDPAPGRGGTGMDEPMVFWVPYGKGKVVSNLMGHVGSLDPMKCVGFKVTLYRACQWLATGKCTTPIPDNFPTAEKTSLDP
jgi:type 1 glutamine amidotransferase